MRFAKSSTLFLSKAFVLCALGSAERLEESSTHFATYGRSTAKGEGRVAANERQFFVTRVIHHRYVALVGVLHRSGIPSA